MLGGEVNTLITLNRNYLHKLKQLESFIHICVSRAATQTTKKLPLNYTNFWTNVWLIQLHFSRLYGSEQGQLFYFDAQSVECHFTAWFKWFLSVFYMMSLWMSELDGIFAHSKMWNLFFSRCDFDNSVNENKCDHKVHLSGLLLKPVSVSQSASRSLTFLMSAVLSCPDQQDLQDWSDKSQKILFALFFLNLLLFFLNFCFKSVVWQRNLQHVW